MKTNLKRLLSALLVVCMLMAIGPVAFAADDAVSGHWAEENLRAFIDAGVLQGDEAGAIQPDANITHAQFAALVNRVAGYTEASEDISDYTDVSEEDWYYEDMAVALASGYLQGDGTQMAPNAEITREETFAVLSRLLGLTAAESDVTAIEKAFSDAGEISDWAIEAVAALNAAGYVGGYPDGTLRPDGALTRAEAVTLLHDAIGVPEDETASITTTTYIDGTYTGTGAGYGGTLTLTMTVADGVISAIKVTSNSETPAYYNHAAVLIDQIIAANGTDGVDAVTGATLSSNAILTAVNACISQAQGGTDTSKTGVVAGGGGHSGSSKTDSSAGETTDNGNGTVMLSGTSYGYSSAGITVAVTVDTATNTITAMEVVSQSETSSYYDGKGVEENLLPQFVGMTLDELAAIGTIAKNATAVAAAGFDNVSGATKSTAGIINAVIAAATAYLDSTEVDNSCIEVSTWDEFLVALDTVDEGGTISLLNDIAAGEDYSAYESLVDAVTSATVGAAELARTVTIEGNNHGFVAAENSAYCFLISGDVTMQNLTIDGAAYGAKRGGGLYVEGTLTAENVTFVNCHSYKQSGQYGNGGGTVYVSGGTFAATDCTFMDNAVDAIGSGGAVLAQGGSATLTNCTFSGNSAPHGGAVAAYSSAALTMTGCTFSGNDGTYGGNDVYVYDGMTRFMEQGEKVVSLNSAVYLTLSDNTYSADGAGWTDYAVVLSRYYEDGYAGNGDGIVMLEGHDLTFADVYRTELEDENTAYESYYVMMNIPYGDFYASEGLETGTYYDAVTSGTVTKTSATSGLARGTYNNYNDDSVYDEGERILSVVAPVKMDSAAYDVLLADYDASADYSFYVCTMAPAVYKEPTYEDGVYSFSAMTGTAQDATGIAVSDFTLTSGYGDYMFDLYGVANAPADAELVVLDASAETIYGIILSFDDGTSIGLGMVENIWLGTRYTYTQIAFSVPEGKQLTGHGGLPFKQFDVNGKTISGIRILSSAGIYDAAVTYELPKYYDGTGEISASGTQGDASVTVTVPEDFYATTVTVSYKSGRTTYYVAEDAEIVDGVVTLTEALDMDTNGTYTVTISSSTYADAVISLEVPMSDAQITTLQRYIATGNALLAQDSTLTRLAEHIAEAEALLADSETTYSEAAELIEELAEIITEAGGSIETEYYVMMNIPYGDFYASEELETGTYYDTVTSATASKTTSTTGTARGTYNNYDDSGAWEEGECILGVVVPVKMTSEAYSALLADYDESADYSFYALDEEPVVYKELTYEDGVYSFSAMTGTAQDATGIDVSDFTATSSYGDYMFDLYGVANAPADAELVVLDASAETIYGIILSFDDGTSIGLGMVENIWLGTRYTYTQIAFSVPEGKQLTGHGGLPFKQFDVNGKTISGIRILSSAGIYDAAVTYELPKYYDGTGEISASGTQGDASVTVTVPEDFYATTVTVSYKSGRTTVTVAENVAIVDGAVALTEALDMDTNGTYTVTVSSSVYADAVISLEAPMSDAQKTTLEEYVETGYALLAQDSTLTRLAEHIAEAEALLADSEATYSEAAELIEELAEIITEAEESLAVYVMMNIPYGVFYASEGLADGTYYDTVTSATASKTPSTTGTARGTYNNYDDNGAYDEGECILGVVAPVKMTSEAYSALLANYDESADYSFYALDEEPAVYKELTYEDGVYSFSTMTGTAQDATGIDVSDFTTTSSYGDYMFDLYGVANAPADA
ncbi:MAG: S-layer homology domain-containing protein, partial [Oscillospiraceae bacterium]|nr:S-layer homology domain-containing protein [Oscillospiraceae bacterium]